MGSRVCSWFDTSSLMVSFNCPAFLRSMKRISIPPTEMYRNHKLTRTTGWLLIITYFPLASTCSRPHCHSRRTPEWRHWRAPRMRRCPPAGPPSCRSRTGTATGPKGCHSSSATHTWRWQEEWVQGRETGSCSRVPALLVPHWACTGWGWNLYFYIWRGPAGWRWGQ